MLKIFPATPEEDICPNCEEKCLETDIFCPKCGGNLDDLFEQQLNNEEKFDLIKTIQKNLPFLNWLTPIYLILAPVIVSLITAISVNLNIPPLFGRLSFFQIIWYAVPPSLLPSIHLLLIISTVPLFLYALPNTRSKIGRGLRLFLVALFSIFSAPLLWMNLDFSNIMTAHRTFAFYGLEVFIIKPEKWIYFLIAGGIILIVLNWIVVIGQEKTA